MRPLWKSWAIGVSPVSTKPSGLMATGGRSLITIRVAGCSLLIAAIAQVRQPMQSLKTPCSVAGMVSVALQPGLTR